MPPYCKGDTPGFSFIYIFFLMSAEAVNVFSAFPFSFHLPSTAEVPDHPPPIHEATPHDLDLPSSMEVDDSQSINIEPNILYVAALQLECNEKNHNMEDSDYESDYFSD